MNSKDCTKLLCKNKITSVKEWRRLALAKKKELSARGIRFDSHEEFKKITECRPTNDVYPNRFDCILASYPPAPAAAAKKERCKTGTRRNKRTGNCEPTGRAPRSPPRPAAPASKKARCKKGTRRNKRTGNCEPK